MVLELEMVYLLIVVILALLALKGFLGKKTSFWVQGNADAFLLNLLRMGMCAFIGLALVFFEGARLSLAIEPTMIAICALSGISNVAFLIGWILAIKKNAMVTVDVSLTLGSLIPAILCALLFAEPISIPKMAGFALIIISTVILAGYSKSTLGKGSLSGAIFLAVASVGDGMMGFAQQLFRHYYSEGGSLYDGVVYPKSVFHFYTYLFAGLCLAVLYSGYRMICKSGDISKEHINLVKPKALAVILVMALCMFISSYLQTVVSNDYGMPSQVLYPIIKGGCLITVNITAMLFFGEKITKRSVIGSLVALAGIIAMNVL